MREATACMDLRPSLGGKVALVTGGLGGIGRATIDTLLAHGASVAFSHAQGVEPPERAQALVQTLPQRLSAHALNLAELASIRDCMGEVVRRWGGIDILVNNAAVGSATVAHYAEDAADQDSAMLRINTDGTLKMSQQFLASPRRAGLDGPRKLISIASVGGGINVFSGFKLSDGMSKAAVAFMTRQLAAEHTDKPVDIFAVCPGATDTPMFQRSTLDALGPDERAAFMARLPRKRMIAPEEIANLVVFLASGYSTVLHGAVIDASMGLGVRPGLMTEFGH